VVEDEENVSDEDTEDGITDDDDDDDMCR